MPKLVNLSALYCLLLSGCASLNFGGASIQYPVDDFVEECVKTGNKIELAKSEMGIDTLYCIDYVSGQIIRQTPAFPHTE